MGPTTIEGRRQLVPGAVHLEASARDDDADLSDLALRCLTVLALLEGASTREGLLKSLGLLGVHDVEGRSLERKSFAGVLEEFRGSPFVAVGAKPGDSIRFYMQPRAIMAVLEQAKARGLLDALVEGLPKLSPRWQPQAAGFSDATRFRLAHLHGDAEAAREALSAIQSRQHMYDWGDGGLPQLFGAEPELAWLAHLDDEGAELYAQALVRNALWSLKPLGRELLDWIVGLAPTEGRHELGMLLALRGEFEAARNLKGVNEARALCVEIFVLFFRGEYSKLVAFARAQLADQPPGQWRALNHEEGLLLALACAIEGVHDPAAEAMFDQILAAPARTKSKRAHEYRRLARLASKPAPSAEPRRRAGGSRRPDMDTLGLLVEYCVSAWTDAELPERDIQVLETLVDHSSSAGLRRLAFEFRGLLTHFRGGGSATQGLVAAFRSRPRWQQTLAGLRALAKQDLGHEPGVKFIRWQVALGEHEVSIRPRLVEGGPNRKGRVIEVAQLLQRDPDFLGPEDRRVLAAVETMAGYERYQQRGRKPQKVLREAGLVALVGHPRVVDPAGQPLTVVAGQAELRVEAEGHGVSIGVFPARLLRASVAWTRSGDRKVTVYQPSLALKQTLALLGQETLQVPETGVAELCETLAALAPQVPVSGTGPVTSIGRPVAPQVRLGARLTWNTEELDVQVVSMPLGVGGPSLALADSAEGVLAEVEGELRSTTRDRAAETAALEQLLARAKTLASSQTGPGHFVGRGLAAAYGILDELLGAECTVFWQSQQSLSPPRRRSSRQLRLGVKKQKDWLSIEVELELDGQQVMDFRELLAARIGRSRFVRLAGHEVLALSRKLARHLDRLEGLAISDAGEDPNFRVHASAVPVLAAVAADVGQGRIGKGARALIDRWRRVQDRAVAVPKTFKGQLRSYQLEGFVWLHHLAELRLGACLADDMGLGKTVQTLALLCRRSKRGPALVVAPASVLPNWRRESHSFAPELRVVDLATGDRSATVAELGPGDLLLCSYGLLAKAQSQLRTCTFATVVFDEAHALKNHRAQRSRAARGLVAEFRVALTGTPIENHLGELWSLMDLLVPKMLGDERSFDRDFAQGIRDGEPGRLEALRARISPFILRRQKSQVLRDLPPLEDIEVRIEASAEAQSFYAALLAEARDKLAVGIEGKGGDQRLQLLAEITRLRRAAIDPRLINPDGPAGGKIATLIERLGQLAEEGHRALVFSQFLGALELLRQGLADAGIESLQFDGSDSQKQRARKIDEFQTGKATAMLISLKAGGTGINLTAADYVFHLDPWWNPAVEDQATARAHRIGQTNKVTAYRLITVGSIEDKIIELHADKRALAADLLGQLDRARRLSVDQLRQLLSLDSASR